MSRRTILVVAVAAILCATALYLHNSFYGGETLHLELRNTSGEAVAHGTILLFGDEHAFGPIEPGGSAELTLPFSGEGGYTVDVEFASGRSLTSGSMGYLTPGMSIVNVVEIREDEISIVEHRVAE